jgi:hypothetical protein
VPQRLGAGGESACQIADAHGGCDGRSTFVIP